MPFIPPFIAPTRHSEPAKALAQVQAIYSQQINHLRDAMQRFVAGEALPDRVRACYPFVRIHTDTMVAQEVLENSGLSYGFVAGTGRYETTLTRPDLYSSYYLEQFTLLRQNHGVELEVGTSAEPIPVHFSFAEHDHIEGNLPPSRRMMLRDLAAPPRRVATARALHRRAGRLFSAPAAPLHRQRTRLDAELRSLHQLPVLHRRVRAAGS